MFGTNPSTLSQIRLKCTSTACAANLGKKTESHCSRRAGAAATFSVPQQSPAPVLGARLRTLRPLAIRESHMLDSVRVRLTLWYSLVLTFVLISLAVLTYFLYWHNTSQRTDSDIAQLSEAFATTFNAEIADETGPGAVKNAAREAMLEHRFRSTYFALLDDSGAVLQSSLDLT